MSLFKTADEELDVEESNIENRLREFTLEDPDEFVDPDSEEETALTGDKRKLYVGAQICRARFSDSEFLGMARPRNGHGNGLDARLLLGSGGLTCGGRSCNAISSLATVFLLCSTLHPTRVVRLRSLLPGRRGPWGRRSLDGSGGRRPRRRTLMLPTRHSLG